MKKKEILSEIVETEKYISEFIKPNKHIDQSKSTFDDWSFKDVLAHIFEWMNYSKLKLVSIKNKTSFNYNVDADEFNRSLFLKDKDLPINQIINDLNNAFSEYKKIIALYADEELLSKDFPTGFSFELWRYMLLDAVIHPCRHMMYQYLKDRDHNSFLYLLNNTMSVFALFSGNSKGIYNFRDFSADTYRLFEILKTEKKRGKVAFLEEIIEINKGIS